jgi:hypothetical protein
VPQIMQADFADACLCEDRQKVAVIQIVGVEDHAVRRGED